MAARWMIPVAVLVVTVSVMCANGGDKDGTTRVTIGQTVINGLKSASYRGRRYFSFRGIPYAKPPVGDLRFRAPQPLSLGAGEINATLDGPTCTQKNYLVANYPMSGQEDCLYLNVYTPQTGAGVNLPVMVYIHGGGWFTGTGASYFNGPDYFMDKDVVLVAFNYRLGALGFLSTDDDAAPGNNGFKDQVAALTWVRDHIAEFGGDPNLVTIFGQSAGSSSVHFHMLSPLSRGLFHRAICQSGTALSAWAIPKKGLPTARMQGELFGCRQTDTKALIECLRGVAALNLTDSADYFHYWSIDPLVVYGPVLERPSGEAFMSEDPMTVINRGKFARVPWLIGTVAQEGIVRALPIVSDPSLLADLNTNWTTLGPRLLEIDISVSADLVDEVWENATRFYIPEGLPLLPNKALGFIDLYSDRSFVHGVHKSSLLHAKQRHDNIYMYNLEYPGLYSYAALFAQNPTNYGTSHCDDLIYLFRAPLVFPDWPKDHPDIKVMDVLTTIWSTFAKHGKPTLAENSPRSLSCDLNSTTSCDLNALTWCPMATTPGADDAGILRTTYLHIGINQTDDARMMLDFDMYNDLYKDRMAFWDAAPLKENIHSGLSPYGYNAVRV